VNNKKLNITLIVIIGILYEMIIVGDLIMNSQMLDGSMVEAFRVIGNQYTIILLVTPILLLICSLIFHLYYKDLIIIKFQNNRAYIMFLLKKVLFISVLLSSSYFILAMVHFIVLGYSAEGTMILTFIGLISLIEGFIIIGLSFLVLSILFDSFIIANIILLFILLIDTFEFIPIRIIGRKMTMPVDDITSGILDVFWMGSFIIIIFYVCILLVSRKDFVKTSNDKEGTS
jgi:hypothetical protein